VARALAAKICHATIALPTPLSPVTSTRASVGAMRAIVCRTSAIAGLVPTRSREPTTEAIVLGERSPLQTIGHRSAIEIRGRRAVAETIRLRNRAEVSQRGNLMRENAERGIPAIR
jgi:hypothetical protein